MTRPTARCLIATFFCLALSFALSLSPAIPAHASAGAPFRVVLDAGHGGSDPGAISPLLPLPEKEVTLRLALLAGAALAQRGIDVVYTRTDDRYVGLGERAALAQRTGAHALVSIHLNSAENPAATGVEAWHGAGARDADLAAALLSALAASLQPYEIPVRGARPGSQLAVLRGPVPAVLIEVGYITNAHDAQHLAEEPFLRTVAGALASGIARFRDATSAGGPNRAALLSFGPGFGPGAGLYVVRTGDTLAGIAARLGQSLPELARLNDIANPQLIVAGQPIRLPAPGSGATSATSNAGAGGAAARAPVPRTYTVVAGDTLSTIAARFDIPMSDLARWNGLAEPYIVRVGQQLQLSAGGPAVTTGVGGGGAGAPVRRYQVQYGDTIFGLAARFGVSREAIIRANGIADPDRLLAGSTLVIPPG
jgi:N-acetylmuramoyl-L-alanine amidase/LysM repeat protein